MTTSNEDSHPTSHADAADPANDPNEASGFSSFGGHLLSAMAPDRSAKGAASGGASGTAALLPVLASLGFEDAEQVVAVAAVPSVRGELQQVLGVDDAAFEAFLAQVQSVLPPTRAALLASPGRKDLGLGVRAPTPAMLAAATEAAPRDIDPAAAAALPASANLIPYFQPIRSQGSRGTCVAFTLSALNEYIERRRGIVRDLSEQHLYFETKLIDGSPGGCGTWQSKAVTVLSARGQCREVAWPYLNALPCNNHGALPAAARPDGLNNRLATLAVPPRDVLSYKTHMSKQRPVTISIPVYNSWYLSQAVRQTGRITMRIGNEVPVGGHAVCLVGYVDTASSPGGGYFIVRNSWGTAAFGSACPFGAGYGTIPYQYIANETWEAYTAVVPGINLSDERHDDNGTDDGDGQDDSTGTGSTVTIAVGRNVKITIETR